jgi:DNA-binding GntR family transcriptional regulator
MAVEPLQIESVVDQVYSVVRDRILSGELPRGTRLRQEALAAELGISRTPLREALRRLAAEGLVEFSPNRGAQVSELRAEDVRSSYEARLILEPGAARLAAVRRPGGRLTAMREAIEAERRSADTAAAFNASRDFHLGLVAASGNDHLLRLAEALWVSHLGLPIFERQAEESGRVESDVSDHQRILDAVEGGDPDLAEALTRRHIASALDAVLQIDA